MPKKKKILRSTKRSRKKKNALQVTSSNTGITHHFDNIDVWEKLSKLFESKYYARQKADLMTAASFDSFMSKQTINTTPDVTLPGTTYRVVSPKINPLSMAGSLADGGRFNIGGAQLSPLFPHLVKQGTLYVAQTLDCALAEIHKPIGNVGKCELSLSKQKLILWDLKKVMAELKYPNLDQIIRDTPVEAVWAYQKIPKPSQILAHYLRKMGGDGIAFESTKVSGVLNYTLFFDNDPMSKNAFSSVRIF